MSSETPNAPPPLLKPSGDLPLNLVFTIVQLGAWGACFLSLGIGGIAFLGSDSAVQEAASGTIMVGGYVFARTVERVAQILQGLLSPKKDDNAPQRLGC